MTFSEVIYMHYNDVIMDAIASKITSLASVYSAVWLGADQRKHQSSASLAFVRGIHRSPVNSPYKGPVTRKMFLFVDVIMGWLLMPRKACPTSMGKRTPEPPQHYSDVIMSMMASHITSVSIVYLTVCSGPAQRKHLNSASLAFVRRIHRWPVNSPHKGPVTRKMFPFDDVIMIFDKISNGFVSQSRLNLRCASITHPLLLNLADVWAVVLTIFLTTWAIYFNSWMRIHSYWYRFIICAIIYINVLILDSTGTIFKCMHGIFQCFCDFYL